MTETTHNTGATLLGCAGGCVEDGVRETLIHCDFFKSTGSGSAITLTW